MRRMRQAHLHELAAELSISSSVRSNTSPDALLDALGAGAELARHAEAQALQVGAARQRAPPRAVRARSSRRGRGRRGAEQQRRVGDRARQRAALVQRRRERDHPVARDRAVRRLQPDDAAQRGGLADRAAGVGADRPRRESRRDRRRGAAARAARHALAVPRVAHDAVAGVLVRRAHRELVHVGLADHRRAGRGQAAHRGRGVERPVALQDAGSGGRRNALGAEEVLDGQRHPAERAVAVAAGSARRGPQERAEARRRAARCAPGRRRTAPPRRGRRRGCARSPRRRTA